MVFPNYLPITAAFMNYALPINALVRLSPPTLSPNRSALTDAP